MGILYCKEDCEMDEKTNPEPVQGEYVLYRGRPLVREGNMICYGCVEDDYLLQMTVMTTKEYAGKEVPDKILIQIVNNDTALPATERIVKQDMKSGFADAFELGTIWLERQLAH